MYWTKSFQRQISANFIFNPLQFSSLFLVTAKSIIPKPLRKTLLKNSQSSCKRSFRRLLRVMDSTYPCMDTGWILEFNVTKSAGRHQYSILEQHWSRTETKERFQTSCGLPWSNCQKKMTRFPRMGNKRHKFARHHLLSSRNSFGGDVLGKICRGTLFTREKHCVG